MYRQTVRISQYVYFGIWSQTLSPPEITERLGMEPDDFMIRGSQTQLPRVVPTRNRWSVRCDEKGLSVDKQVAKVLDRLKSFRDKIANLSRDLAEEQPPGGMGLMVVRYFDDDDGEEESERETIDPDGTTWERLPGQHQLLGWSLDSEVLEFLHAVGGCLSVDEYG